MASISTDKTGNRTIQFVRGDGSRTSIRLGKVPLQHVRKVKLHVEALSAAKRAAVAMDDRTADWLRGIDDDLRKKLVAVGLVEPRLPSSIAGNTEVVPTLGEFLKGYIRKRSDVKESTSDVYYQTRQCLIAHFGADKRLSNITAGNADDFRTWLKSPKDRGGRGLAENTVRRRCGVAKMFFRAAARHKLITEDPFADMKGTNVVPNRSRDYFVTREEAAAVLDACPDTQWRLIFALCRYGGLRCPSEHAALRWGDIDWERERFTVHAPKTEHHEAGGERVTPMFPELRPYLEAAYDEAEEGTEFVISRRRLDGGGLRTGLSKIIRRAGLVPWPKIFINLRATRSTELAEDYPAHVSAAWLGHSTTIADKHYRQTTEVHFAKAVQNPVQQVTATACNVM